MRTTIELPSDIRQKLIAEVAVRNLKGFSSIIVEALEIYLGSTLERRKEEVNQLYGCMDPSDYRRERAALTRRRKQWRTLLS
jgi:hypothetical protein